MSRVWMPTEPPCGSVVMAHGNEGTAWQRWYSDEKWHSTTGDVSSWSDLCEATMIRLPGGSYMPNLHVIHRTEEVA